MKHPDKKRNPPSVNADKPWFLPTYVGVPLEVSPFQEKNVRLSHLLSSPSPLPPSLLSPPRDSPLPPTKDRSKGNSSSLPFGNAFLICNPTGKKKKNYSYSVFPQEAVEFESLTLSLRGTEVQQSHWPLRVTNFNFLHLVIESSRATEESQDHWGESDPDSKPSSAGNYIQYPVINQDKKEYKKEYLYMYI